MSRLRSGSGLGNISATKLQRVLDLQKDQIGPVSTAANEVQRQYTYAIGRNECGYDLLPGAPVRIGVFTPQESTDVMPRIGWYQLRPAWIPRTASQYTDTRTNMWSIGVMLDYCPDTTLARFAIAGVVECRMSGSGWFAGMFESSNNNHQSMSQASYAMGFGRIVASIDANWAKVELGCAVGPTLVGTASGAITAGSAGTVTLKHPTTSGWAASAHTVPAWTDGSTIPTGSLVELKPVDGRHFAVRFC